MTTVRLYYIITRARVTGETDKETQVGIDEFIEACTPFKLPRSDTFNLYSVKKRATQSVKDCIAYLCTIALAE